MEGDSPTLNEINYRSEISRDNTMLNQDQSDQEQKDKANTVKTVNHLFLKTIITTILKILFQGMTSFISESLISHRKTLLQAI